MKGPALTSSKKQSGARQATRAALFRALTMFIGAALVAVLCVDSAPSYAAPTGQGASTGRAASAGQSASTGRVALAPRAVPAEMPAPVVEKDAQGKPLFYYGRLFLTTREQLRVLDLLAFRHDRQPFFDEFDSTKFGAPATPEAGQPPEGFWEYAIATGLQWNVLIKTPGLAASIELNPRVSAGPHPVLDGFLDSRSDGSLDPKKLAESGFSLPAFPLKKRTTCGLPQTVGFFDDLGDFFEDLGEAIADGLIGALDLIGMALQGSGEALAGLLELAAQGVKEASDFLRELGNDAYCGLTSARSNEGQVFVRTCDDTSNPKCATLLRPLEGPGFGQPEPIRGAKIRGRAGLGGLLLTETTIDPHGRYRLDSLCSDLTYTLAVEFDSPAAFITYNGYFPDQSDLGDVGVGVPLSTWTVSSKAAVWQLGAQIGREFSQRELGFSPKQTKIVLGWVTDDIIGSINGGVSMAVCKQLSILAPVISLIPLGALAAPLLDGDIYGASSSFDKSNPFGVTVHEYGHYAMCEAIDQFGGSLGSFRNAYMVDLLATAITSGGDQDEAAFSNIRNSAEGFADLFTSLSVGYTDYFNKNGSATCTTRTCLESDASFKLPADQNDHSLYPDWVASRASLMYDWSDGIAVTDDDTMQLPRNAAWVAAAHAGAQVTTQNAAAWLAGRPEYGRPAEGLCRVFQNHGWNCDDIDFDGAHLDAPLGFEGRATSTSDIEWTWAPTSALATGYVLLREEGTTLTEVASLPPDAASHTQSLGAGAGNRPVVALVEARREGATPGRTARVRRCTLADAAAAVVASSEDQGVRLSWGLGGASDYAIMRAEAGGSFTEVGIAPEATTTFVDDTAAPGVEYDYRVDARNCDGVATAGPVVRGSFAPNDENFIFVRAGAVGGQGTRAAPFATLNQALELLSAQRYRVAIAGGSYPERVTLSSSLSRAIFYGGYDDGFNARDLAAHPSVLPGNDSPDYVGDPGDDVSPEYRNLFHAFDTDLTLDGLEIMPSLRPCAPGCPTLGAAAARSLTMRNVRFVAGPGVPGVPGLFNLAPSVTASGDCDISDSRLDNEGLSERVLVACNRAAQVQNSVLRGGTQGRVLMVGDGPVVVDRSLLRGDNAAWSAAGTIGILNRVSETRVTNSIIAAQTALDAVHAKIAYSTIYSSFRAIEGETITLVDDIIVSETDFAMPIRLLVNCNGACPPHSGNVVRNTAFVMLGTGADPYVAQTTYTLLAGTVAAKASQSNQVGAWFGSGPNNEISGNVVVRSNGDIFNLADPGNVSPLATGLAFRPRPGGPATSSGIDPTPYGFSLPGDIEGKARPQLPFGVGPYTP